MTDSQLKYMKSVFHNELKHRKEIDTVVNNASEKILKDNIDEN